MRIWLIDDDPGNHAAARATLALVPGMSFTGFASGREAIAALAGGAPAPDVVLMDFYLGGERGDEVTRRWRRAEAARGVRALVVGYSTARHGSEASDAAGGDAIVPKRRDGDGINPWLLEWLRSGGGDG